MKKDYNVDFYIKIVSDFNIAHIYILMLAKIKRILVEATKYSLETRIYV